MRCKNSKTRIPCPVARARGQGLTLLEMVIALAIITVIFAVIVPQFRMILSSWDSRAGAAETIQNGRILIDHLNRNLAKAVKITAVSDSSATNGYIEFEDNDENTLRYDVASNYVEFGVVGDLSDLAGPVSQLQFTCYDACDLDTPITDVNSIRFVKVETTLTNPAAPAQDKTFTAQAYLRTKSGPAPVNFGNQNEEAEVLISEKNSLQFATQVTLDEDGTAASISAYVKGPPVKKLRYALYTDDSNEPGTLLVGTNTEAIGSNLYHWHNISITPTELSAGTYWLALAFEVKNMYVRQSDIGFGQSRGNTNDAVTNGFNSPWGTSSQSNTRRISIYATYAPSRPILP